MNQSEPSQDELNVSQILLDLRNQLSPPQYLPDFKWGRARKRSRPDEDPPSPRQKNPTPEKSPAASPTSPLSFSPTDSNNRQPRVTEAPIQKSDVPRGVTDESPERNRRMEYSGDGVGPHGIGINLNVPPVEASREPLDDKQAKCAEARRKRRLLMRAKKYPTQTRICDGFRGEPLGDDNRTMCAETRRKRMELMRAKRESKHTRKRRELMRAKQESIRYVSISAMCAEARRKRRELMRAKRVCLKSM